MSKKPTLEFCKSSDPRYQEIRDRHYVPNKGAQGQQLHFIIHYKGQVAGIISAASSVYAVKNRDDFFKIPKDKEQRQKYFLPAIVNNSVFRLELHEKNLATKVLARWRVVVKELWKKFYGVDVIGFETFVIETDTRKGCLYLADNWTMVGMTSGNAKAHAKGGMTGKHFRQETEKKIIYCKKINGNILTKPYVSSWRAVTPEEKARAKDLSKLRQSLIGRIF
jgi:hypothetical protein